MGKDYHGQMAGKRNSSANNRPEEGIWGRVTTPRRLEKDSLQLTTDQKKAYGEGLPRPDGWKKDFLQLTTDQKKAYEEGLPRPDAWKKIFFS